MTHKIEYDQNDAAARILYAKVNPTDKFAFPILANSGGSLSVQILDPAGIPAEVDNSTHTLQTITYEHHEIHSGSHYTVHGYVDIPGADDVLDFTWQMPNTTKWIHWNWSIEFEKGCTFYIYEGVIATNPLANPATPINSNRNSLNTSGTIMLYEIQANLAAANADTSVTGSTLLISGKLGDNRTAGDASRENEFVLKQGALYCLRAATTGAGWFNFDMQWYEHTDKD